MKKSIKILAALMLFLAVFAFSAFRDNKPQLVVVVDAGHGGRDSGSLEEKDVVLKISRILATYSDKKIKIIETRSTDKLLTLTERVDIINKHNPDLLISLHCNANKTKTSLNGVLALYYADNDFNEKSQQFSKTLVENQLDLFSDRGAVKSSLIYMLKNINCPGVYLEMGYLTNENDRAILLDENHQKTIAKSLYESLLKIREYKGD